MDNQAEAQQQGQEQGATHSELTITDLTNLRSIVDVAVRRGAFSASEVGAVGATYDRLNSFLTSVTPPKTEEPK